MLASQRQVHPVIRRSRGQVDSEAEAGSSVNHHGKNRGRRTDQVDVGPSDMCGNEQAARGPGQGKSAPLKNVRPPADGGARIPRFCALDHLNWLPELDW